MKVIEELSRTLGLLAEKRPLSASEAEAAVDLLSGIIRRGQAEEEWSELSELARDDAWDALLLFEAVHHAAIPYLCAVIRSVGDDTGDDRYARKWAIKAVEKIGPTDRDYISSLEIALKSSDYDLQQQAKRVLKRRHPSQDSVSWLNRVFAKLRIRGK